MELNAAKLTLLSKGADTNIYAYGEPDSAVVLKVAKCNTKESKHLLNEYTILKQLHHQYIITPFKFKQGINTENMVPSSKYNAISEVLVQDSKQSYPNSDILVMEHAPHGNFVKIMRERSLSVPQKRFLFSQICEAVDYLHCKYIVHRDLKLENILICTNDNAELTAKLADFGFASHCRLGQQLIMFNSFKGTRRGYMAPQIHLTLTDSEKFYDARKSDIFALGVVLFALVLGRLPFEYSKTQNRLYKLIAQEKYDEFWKEHFAALKKLEQKQETMVECFKQLFISMVRNNPSQRIANGQADKNKQQKCDERERNLLFIASQFSLIFCMQFLSFSIIPFRQILQKQGIIITKKYVIGNYQITLFS